MDFLNFLAKVSTELYNIFQLYSRDQPPDPEEEKQAAMALIRKASDIQAKKEIEG